MRNESIYEVFWQGPYKPKKLKKLTSDEEEKLCLYSIYGSHPLYGDNSLLYIGITERGAKKRMGEHGYWMDQERFSVSRIYLASIGEFKDWVTSSEVEIFDKPDRKIIESIESLLIYAMQPCFNTKNRNSADTSRGVRIFNTGRYGSLHPEISALYEEI